MNDDLVKLIADIVDDQPDDHRPTGLSPLWETLAELGLTGIGVPEERGGAGGDLGDLVTAVRALARHGVDVPLAEVAIARWADPRVAVESAVPIAVPAEISQDQTAGGFTLASVPFGHYASSMLVLGRSHSWEICDFDVVPADGSLGVLSDVVVTGGVAKPFTPMAAARAVEVRGALLVAARLTGATEGAYQLTKAYVAQREQFGKPLLKIPAVAANLARIKTSLVESDVALAKALDQVQTEPEAWTAVAAARVVTARTASEVARIGHQLHGAMGTTEEYPLGRFSRILWAWPEVPISATTWADRLGALSGADGEQVLWEDVTTPV